MDADDSSLYARGHHDEQLVEERSPFLPTGTSYGINRSAEDGRSSSGHVLAAALGVTARNLCSKVSGRCRTMRSVCSALVFILGCIISMRGLVFWLEPVAKAGPFLSINLCPAGDVNGRKRWVARHSCSDRVDSILGLSATANLHQYRMHMSPHEQVFALPASALHPNVDYVPILAVPFDRYDGHLIMEVVEVYAPRDRWADLPAHTMLSTQLRWRPHREHRNGGKLHRHVVSVANSMYTGDRLDVFAPQFRGEDRRCAVRETGCPLRFAHATRELIFPSKRFSVSGPPGESDGTSSVLIAQMNDRVGVFPGRSGRTPSASPSSSGIFTHSDPALYGTDAGTGSKRTLTRTHQDTPGRRKVMVPLGVGAEGSGDVVGTTEGGDNTSPSATTSTTPESVVLVRVIDAVLVEAPGHETDPHLREMHRPNTRLSRLSSDSVQLMAGFHRQPHPDDTAAPGHDPLMKDLPLLFLSFRVSGLTDTQRQGVHWMVGGLLLLAVGAVAVCGRAMSGLWIWQRRKQ